MRDRKVIFEKGRYYHVFNRGNAGSNIFFQSRNYKYFLSLYKKFLLDYLNTLAYCLLPNHFHFLVQINSQITDDNISKVISEGFRKLFITYTQAINKQERRHGSLFQKNFKRIEVDDEDYLSRLIGYIHLNPVKHGLVNDFKNYPHSSFKSFLSDKPTNLSRLYVLNWFGGLEQFEDFHNDNKCLYLLDNYTLE